MYVQHYLLDRHDYQEHCIFKSHVKKINNLWKSKCSKLFLNQQRIFCLPLLAMNVNTQTISASFLHLLYSTILVEVACLTLLLLQAPDLAIWLKKPVKKPVVRITPLDSAPILITITTKNIIITSCSNSWLVSTRVPHTLHKTLSTHISLCFAIYLLIWRTRLPVRISVGVLPE